MPVLVTARLSQSNSKLRLGQQADLRTSETHFRPVAGRDNLDTTNLLQLKGFELSLKRKVAETYGGSYRDLSRVDVKRQSHHKSVQTLRTASVSDLSVVRDRQGRRRPHSLDMSHSVVPCHRVIIREGSTSHTDRIS